MKKAAADYYFEHEESLILASPDANFPIINGEKGNVTLGIHFQGNNEGDFTLQSFLLLACEKIWYQERQQQASLLHQQKKH